MPGRVPALVPVRRVPLAELSALYAPENHSADPLNLIIGHSVILPEPCSVLYVCMFDILSAKVHPNVDAWHFAISASAWTGIVQAPWWKKSPALSSRFSTFVFICI